jgi:hypothetical protein
MSLTIAHRLPGRLRAIAPTLRDDPDALRRIEREVLALDGVRAATGNHVTGSLLIEYDHEAQDERAVVARLQEATGMRVRLNGLNGDLAPSSGMPAFAEAIQAPFQRLNTGLASLTKNNIDLRFLVPVLLAAYGTLKLLRQGPVPAIPWYLLYWWSFRSFILLNRQIETKETS